MRPPGTEDSTQKKIKAAVIVITIFVTIFAMRYVKTQNNKVKEAVIYRRRKARYESVSCTPSILAG